MLCPVHGLYMYVNMYLLEDVLLHGVTAYGNAKGETGEHKKLLAEIILLLHKSII